MVREDLVDHVAVEQSPDGSERVSRAHMWRNLRVNMLSVFHNQQGRRGAYSRMGEGQRGRRWGFRANDSQSKNFGFWLSLWDQEPWRLLCKVTYMAMC